MSDTTGMDATPFDDESGPEQASSPSYGRKDKPGAVLARHREMLGWSVEHVAEQLKMAPRQVVALEADDYAALPGLAVVRGFVRAYAKILKIDAAPLTAMIEVEAVAPSVPHHLPSDLSRKMAQSGIPVTSGQPGRIWLLAGGGVVLILALVAAAQYMGYIQPMDQWVKSQPAPASAVATAPSGTTVHALPSPVAQAPNAAVTTLPPPAATSTATPAAATTSVTPAAPATTAAAATTTAAPTTTIAAARTATTTTTTTTAAAAPSGSAGDVEFTVREDTWVQLKLADGTNVVSRLLKAGAVETFPFDGEAVLVIGNVAGVDVKVRGEPLPVKSVKGNNTARITIK